MHKYVLTVSATALMVGALMVGAPVAGPALAADLPTRAAPAAPVAAAPAFTWTGFYVGANAGYGWGSVRLTDSDGDWISGRLDGAIGGGQIGYNFQTGSVVLGVETDIQATGLSRSFVDDDEAVTSKIQYFGTVRGRIGMSFDNIMPYVTAGLAYANNKITAREGNLAISSSKTHFGWTVGAGVEADLGNGWSVKGEYLYVDMPNKTYLPNLDGGVRVRSDFHVARIGLNYRF